MNLANMANRVNEVAQRYQVPERLDTAKETISDLSGRMAERMSAAGHPSPGGENVAQGQSNPHAVMTAWMDSPPHRANILNAEFKTLGVGVELGGSGPYWTQNFGY